MMVISSIFSSSLTHASTAFFCSTYTASLTSFLTNAGTTRFITSSLEMNSHNPSEAITINLCSNFNQSITFLNLEFHNLRLTYNADFRGHHIPKRSRHRQAGNVLSFHPHSVRAHLLAILIIIRLDSSSIYDNPLSFDWILAFVIFRKWLRCPPFSIPTENHSSRISQIGTVYFILANVS